ncbi:MAG: hypothetical protein ACO3D2_05235 [Holophagaceae bacterium]
MPSRRRYSGLFSLLKPDCWVRSYPELVVLEVALFKEPFFKTLTIEARTVFIGLLMMCYENCSLIYDHYDLADYLAINRADFQNSVQELERTYDPYFNRPLVEFYRDENNLRHLYMPIVDRKIRPKVLQAKDLYRQTGRFSRLTREQKEELLGRHEAA